MLFTMNISREKTNINFNFYIKKYNNMVRRICLTLSPNSLFKLFSILLHVLQHALGQIKLLWFVNNLFRSKVIWLNVHNIFLKRFRGS